MSDELSPASRALLDNARGALGPDAAAIARMRSRIDASIATGTAATTGATLGTKLAVLGAVAAIVAGAVIYRQLARPSATDAPTTEQRIEQRVEATRRAVETAPAPPPLQTAEATVVDDTIDIPTEIPIEMPPTIARRPPKATVDLAREVELVDRAMAAMKRGEHAVALEAVRLHVRETNGKGQLAEDAAAIEIEAMCRSKQAVTAKLAAFDARWPTSAQRSRLSNVCP